MGQGIENKSGKRKNKNRKTKNGPEETQKPLQDEESAGGARGQEERQEKFLVRELREKLHQALAREQEAQGELQRFMHMLSHDLRSPISTVSNFLGIILARQGGVLDEKSKEYIGYSLEIIKNMSHLLTATLYYIKIGSRMISEGEVDSTRVLQRALLELRDKIEKTGAEIKISAPGLPVIRGDETLLVQVFQNLLANSLKFSEDTPRVRISAARHEATGRDLGSSAVGGGGEWLFSFRDNGPGIKPEDQARIFEPFVHIGAGRDGKGAGLGLAICKKIVELHGGRIWVESAPGEGSTFYFTIPD